MYFLPSLSFACRVGESRTTNEKAPVIGLIVTGPLGWTRPYSSETEKVPVVTSTPERRSVMLPAMVQEIRTFGFPVLSRREGVAVAVIVGGVQSTMKSSEFEVPPPGLGLRTLIAFLPSVAVSVAGIAAFTSPTDT